MIFSASESHLAFQLACKSHTIKGKLRKLLSCLYVSLLSDTSVGNDILTKATVPIYATGVLTCYNQAGVSHFWFPINVARWRVSSYCVGKHLCPQQEEDRKLLVGFLEDVMTTLSLSHAPLDSLKASFVELGWEERQTEHNTWCCIFLKKKKRKKFTK